MTVALGKLPSLDSYMTDQKIHFSTELTIHVGGKKTHKMK